eukprot:TRINITY_DN8112_c2_g1_i1.p2 TRINITY_DN8112_c2_g1~~TRINITY_DN8112_c2_g1_i1.p2  ORF type:complete len:105 (-),score=5.42 TRINITY_DN8112_c2_g1_i1:46-360(-)
MMGVFVLTYSIGNVVAGLLAGNFDPERVDEMPNLFIQISLFSIAIGIVVLLLSFKTRLWEKAEDKEGENLEKAPAQQQTQKERKSRMKESSENQKTKKLLVEQN